jgi:hypothetical protein
MSWDRSVSIATGYRLDDQDSIPSRGKIFLFMTFRLGLKPTQPPVQWVPGAVSLRVKRQMRQADHSPPASVEVKNGGAIPPLPIRHNGVVLN